jgi:hypothetical protein
MSSTLLRPVPTFGDARLYQETSSAQEREMSDRRRDYGPAGCAKRSVQFGLFVALLLTITRKGRK